MFLNQIRSSKHKELTKKLNHKMEGKEEEEKKLDLSVLNRQSEQHTSV